nr:S-layer homology domain-containing protein [uncultured Agathobaculum sp.]
MSKRLFYKRLLSMFMAVVMVFGMFPLFGSTASAADTQVARDITTNYPSGVTPTVTARVDESVGLRGTVTINSTITGISPLDVKIRDGQAVTGDTIEVSVAAADKYTFASGKIVTIAEVTHADKTVDAYQHVQALNNGTNSYTIPKFGAYVEQGDTVTVAITAYADFDYQEQEADITIDVSGTTPTITGDTNSAVSYSGTGRQKLISIDSSKLNGQVVKVTGRSIRGENHTDGTWHVHVQNSQKNTTAESRRVDLILEDLWILTTASTTTSNYKTYVGHESPQGPRYNSSVAGNTTRWSTTTKPAASPLVISDTDVHVTLKGQNVLYVNSWLQDGGSTNGNGIVVDATGSLIVTNASTGSMEVQGGDCSSAIGTSGGNQPSGYVEIDGGEVYAYSAFSSHCYAGIGNGGHYSSTDPGTRGFVMTDGTLEALGFHYGIGGNGGSGTASNSFDQNVGRQYIVVTGGNLVAEGGGGSAGAALGWAYNNDYHVVRVGRIGDDNNNLNLKAVNWGHGAGISGRMYFYSGTTEAYSGEYAAAIGGNAVSQAWTSAATESTAQGGSTAMTGTQLRVYGGDITAIAAAFENYTVPSSGQIAPQDWRGQNANRLSHTAVDKSTALKGTIGYGAAIGGANTKTGGSETYLFGGTLNAQSSQYGAGIGGGGGYGNYAAGGGGTTRFGSLTDLSGANEQAVAMNVTVNSSTYGAGIGGGGVSGSGAAGSGGDGLYISTRTTPPSNTGANQYSFTINSGKYGAGIGGGGNGGTGAAGAGASELIINGGNFWIESGGTASDTNNFGAGIGGGGSNSGTAGNGPTTARLNGGYFAVNSKGYGSAIGGGGTNSGTAGGCGTIYVTGGTITAENTAGNSQLQGLGGGAAVTGTSKIDNGNVIIIGGNVYTTAGTQIPNANLGQYVWTLPNNANLPSGSTSGAYNDPDTWNGTVPSISGSQDPLMQTTTGRYQVVSGIPAGRIGQAISRVQYSFPSTGTGNPTSSFFDYGTNDTFVTSGPDGDGEIAVWVPAGYRLSYDLNPVEGNATGVTVGSDTYNVNDSQEWASGTVALIFPEDQGSPSYTSTGQRVYLLQPETRITSDLLLGEDANITGLYGDKEYADGRPYKELLNHDDVTKLTDCSPAGGTGAVSTPVVFAGWSLEPENRIFDAHQGYYPDFVDYVDFTTRDQTVYAVWGYDENENGVADILESHAQTTYNANGGSNAPTTVHQGISGTRFSIASGEPDPVTNTNNIFVGWSLTRPDGLITIDNYTRTDGDPTTVNSTDYSEILDNLYIYNGSLSFGSGGKVEGSSTIIQSPTVQTLYAVWATDTNNNRVPDYLETEYQITFEDLLNTGAAMPSSVSALPNIQLNITGYVPTGTAMHNGIRMIFGGWTTNQSFASRSYGYSDLSGITQADVEAQQVSNPYAMPNANVTFYPIWLEDRNNNNNADISEGADRLIYDDPSGSVTTTPVDNNLYYGGETATGERPELQYGADLMKASGVIFMGWTTDSSKGRIYGAAEESVYNTAFANAPDYSTSVSTTTPDLYNATWNGQIINWPASNRLYAVWVADTDNDGIPDWDDDDINRAPFNLYYSSGMKQLQQVGAQLDQNSLPNGDRVITVTDVNTEVEELTVVDENGGAGYAEGVTVPMDTSKTPSTVATSGSEHYVFLGWSPLFWERSVFGNDPNSLDDFKRHLDLIYDIKHGTNYSESNLYGNSSGPYISEAGSGSSPESARGTFYTLKGNGVLDGDDTRWSTEITDWSQYQGEGLLESVTQAAVDWANNTASSADGAYVASSWTVYPIWGVDANANGQADMFESGYNLVYEGNGAGVLNVPRQEARFPGEHVTLQTGVNGVSISRNGYVFIGWTTEPNAANGGNLQDHYTDSLADKEAFTRIPIISTVTMPASGLTVYAVWGTDEDGNGQPDVLDREYTLTYMSNTNRTSTPTHGGGNGDPRFNITRHQWRETVQLDYDNTPTDGNYAFMWWTLDDGKLEDGSNSPTSNMGYVWKENDNWEDLPAKCTEVTFEDSNVTVYAVWGEDNYTLDEDTGELTPGSDNVADILQQPLLLTYDANGGKNPPAPSYHFMDDTVQLNTAAAGIYYQADDTNYHVFMGWSMEQMPVLTGRDDPMNLTPVGGGATVNLGDIIVTQVTFLLDDITVYAIWGEDSDGDHVADIVQNKYSVSYDLNGGVAPENIDYATEWYEAGDSFTVPAQVPTKDGLYFAYWIDGTDRYYPGETYTSSSDVKLVAQYTATQFTVTYNNGTGSERDFDYASGSQVTVQGSLFTAPSGETFDYWLGSDGSIRHPGDTFIITSDVTFTAQWKALPPGSYNIHANPPVGDGEFTVSHTSALAGETVTIITTGTVIGKPTVTNDQTGGNITVNDIGGGRYTFIMPAADVTVNVTFESGGVTPPADEYDVKVQSSGNGTAIADKSQAEAGETVTITTTGTVNSITVTDQNGATVAVTNNGGGVYTFTMPASGVTVSVVFSSTGGGGTGGGGTGGGGTGGGGTGGGGTTSPTDQYPVNVRPSGNGTATADKNQAAAGETVTITTNGTVENITVTDQNGNNVTVTDNGNGEYTFTMPASGVTVNVEFDGTASLPGIADPDDTGVSGVLNTEDHMAYMVGDSAGTFRPASNITRAEVATIFYRLLLDTSVDQMGQFSDVATNAWYYEAVATLAAKGIITGYEDGTFRPNNAITRAEFAAIATRFAEANNTGSLLFTDVSTDAWYYEAVLTAANYGWINGYSDNTYRPAQSILRSEAAKIVNCMLGRIADRSAVDGGAGTRFPDVSSSHWAFYEIVEATTNHEYTRESNTAEETWQ